MFAILFHESMEPFHQTVTSFPTVIFTTLLFVCIFYWAVAALGLVDIDFIDFDMDGDIDLDDSVEFQGSIAGLLMKLGLNGVPTTIIITVFTLTGWVLSYFISLFGLKLIPDLLVFELPFKIVVFAVVSIVSIFITALIIRPFRKFFQDMDVDETKHIVGQEVVIRSSTVNNKFGEAIMNDGGAGLLLSVRTRGSDEFKKGDEVVVIEHIKSNNTYIVISKSEFN